MNTSTRKNDNAATDLKDILEQYAGWRTDRYETVKAEYLRHVETNPAEAIRWDSAEIVKAQAVHEVWMRISRELTEHDAREVLRENLDELNRRIRAFFGSHSTSEFVNAASAAQTEAIVREVEELERLAARHNA